MILPNVIDRDEHSFKRLGWGKGSLFPPTNLLYQSFRGSETCPWCLHTTKKLQCKIAQAPVCPPLSWDLWFCTTNTTVLLIYSSLRVLMSIETPHKAVLFSSSTLSGRRRNSMSLRWEEEAQTSSIFSYSPLVKQRCHGASTPPALWKERGDGKGENRLSVQHRIEDKANCMEIVISQPALWTFTPELHFKKKIMFNPYTQR